MRMRIPSWWIYSSTCPFCVSQSWLIIATIVDTWKQKRSSSYDPLITHVLVKSLMPAAVDVILGSMVQVVPPLSIPALTDFVPSNDLHRQPVSVVPLSEMNLKFGMLKLVEVGCCDKQADRQLSQSGCLPTFPNIRPSYRMLYSIWHVRPKINYSQYFHGSKYRAPHLYHLGLLGWGDTLFWSDTF